MLLSKIDIITKVVLPLATSFSLVFFLLPIYIKIASKKKLFDYPEGKLSRKSHKLPTPSMGGLIIFVGTIFSFLFWYPENSSHFIKYFLSGAMILLMQGIKDDIIGLAPVKKLLIQFLVGFIMVFIASMKITSFYGFLGAVYLPDWVYILVSILIYATIVNGINLIDGLDGLAGGVSVFILSCYSVMFYFLGDNLGLTLSITLIGSVIAFLIYNSFPSKIFMGDTGSLFIGFVIAILSIRLLERPNFLEAFRSIDKPIFLLSVLSYPLLDLFRIFISRILKGKSPLKADKKHIHHILNQSGLSHNKTLLAVLLFSFISVLITYLLRDFSRPVLFGTFLLYIILIVILIYGLDRRNMSLKDSCPQ